MRTITAILCAVVGVCMLAGCHGAKKELLSVDFKEGQTLRYKQISERQTALDFDPTHKASKGDSGRMQNMGEKLEMVVAYTPVKVEQSGFSTIKATFEKVKPMRTGISGQQPSSKDAVTYLEGKSFNFTISPSGLITDNAEFTETVKKLGEEAFGGKAAKGVKDPDMIQDFMTLQIMMWDTISSIKRPASGIAVGEKWQSQLLAPMPMPARAVRDVTYTLSRVEEINGQRIADINSVYTLSKQTLSSAIWPLPYSGSFQMRGLFGFLGGYSFLSLKGGGTEKFNISAGRVQRIDQEYETNVAAQMPFGLGSQEATPTPNMVIKQKLSVELMAP